MQNYTGLTDAALLDRFRQLDDAEALSTLILRYHRIVRVVCRQVLGPSPEEDDAYQTTFLLLLKRADRIRHAPSVGSWLYGVAYRVAWRMRHQRAQRLHADVLPKLAASDAEPFALLSAEDQRLAAHAAIAALPNGLRMPLVLRYLEGYTNREVAEHLSLTEAAVEGRLKRAKSRLRTQLARRGLLLTTLLAAVEQAANVQAAELALTPHALSASIEAIRSGHALRSKPVEQTFQHVLREEVRQMIQTQLMNWSVAVGVCAISTAVLLGPPWARSGAAQQQGGQALGNATRVIAQAPASEDPFTQATVRVETNADSFADSFAQTNREESPTGIPDGVDSSASPATDTLTPKYRSAYQDPATEAIAAALDQPTRIEFIDEPLSSVIDFLRQLHEIPIHVDRAGLEEQGVTTDDTITFGIADVSLASALNLMLKDLGLSYTIANEVLLITTKEAATENVNLHVYKLSENWPLTADATIDLITAQVAPDTWNDTGGPGAIDGFGLTLVVSQSMEVHQQIVKLLTQLDSSFQANPTAAAAAEAAMKTRSLQRGNRGETPSTERAAE
jgi:RNA polymerase sigma factor (sigma-70 family)